MLFRSMAGGDISKFQKSEAELETMTKVISTIAPLVKTQAGRSVAQMYLDGVKSAFPNIPTVQSLTLDSFGTLPGNGASAVTMKDEQGREVGHYIVDPQTGELKQHYKPQPENKTMVQTSDDGKSALVEFVGMNPQALAFITESNAPGVRVFERGKATKGQIEAEFQKKIGRAHV